MQGEESYIGVSCPGKLLRQALRNPSKEAQGEAERNKVCGSLLVLVIPWGPPEVYNNPLV